MYHHIDITDSRLVENIRKDDYASYNLLFTRYYNRLCLFANSITGNNSDAEDIVQELFIKLWNNRKKSEVQTTVSGYLYQSVKNMALNHIRRETNRKNAIDKMKYSGWHLNDAEIDNIKYSFALENCIDQLPERSKEVVLMQYLQGYKQKEIASKLNISVNTIKNLIWKSLQRIKICLELKKM